jgi:poly(3-hydroxybutyrate) depolymerase
MIFDRRLLSVFSCLIYLFAVESLFAAKEPSSPSIELAPGKETRVDSNNKDIGGGFFLVYVPSDYSDLQNWPVIFFYNGVGCQPSTELFRLNTDGKGFVIIAMEYVPQARDKMTNAQYINMLRSEIKSIAAAKAYVSKHLRIDSDKMFIAGISKGGWLVSSLFEFKPSAWAGAAIFCAGRNNIVTDTPKSLLYNKAVYIGSGEKDQNLNAAKKAAGYYGRLETDITFEIYKGLGHAADPNSQKLRNWLIKNSSKDKPKGKMNN